MHMTEEQWNIDARREIQEVRSHLAEALEALSKPECDFDAAALAMSKARCNGDRIMSLIETGRNEHAD